MDRACEGNETRKVAATLGHRAMVPPHPNRREP